MKTVGPIDLGAKKWRGIWVNKNDIVEFLRCEYRVYLSHLTGVTIAEMKDAQALRAILELGRRFEESVIKGKELKDLESEKQLVTLQHTDMVLRTPQLFRNHDMGIQGIPDLIDMGRGRLYPIEIKMHKELKDSDTIELAFYWSLLEPLRRVRTKPRGYVILGTGETIEVKITADDILNVQFLIDEVREAKKNGAEPILSQECKLCSLLSDCRREVAEKGGLSLIYNVSHVRQSQLKELGVVNISGLAQADAMHLHENWLQQFQRSPGYDEICRMQAHAFSLISRRPAFFGDRASLRNLRGPHVVVDLEYDPESHIWLAGAYIKDEVTDKVLQYFAESLSPSGERAILLRLRKALKDNGSSPILTYGASADWPQLRKAWLRQGFPRNEYEGLEQRHLDLYGFICHSFRFPLATLGLKDVEQYLGFKREGERMDGLIALGKYREYLRVRNKARKQALKRELLTYNAEDLKATAFVASQLERLLPECLDAGPI